MEEIIQQLVVGAGDDVNVLVAHQQSGPAPALQRQAAAQLQDVGCCRWAQQPAGTWGQCGDSEGVGGGSHGGGGALGMGGGGTREEEGVRGAGGHGDKGWEVGTQGMLG